MGSTAEVLIDGDAALVAGAFARLRGLEQTWSRFIEDSELNRLLRAAGGWRPASNDLIAALAWCVRLHAETGGLFDPSIRASLEGAGYDRTILDVRENDAALPAPRPAPGLDGIELDRERNRVRLPVGVSLDLGGIGKGLAADIVAAEAVAAGARSAYVAVGGDIHAAGEPPDGSWSVPLLHPVTGDVLAVHALASGGLVMSTVVLRTWRRGGNVIHHIIDPRSGRPSATDVLTVAVAARRAARAEGIAKSVILAGRVAGAALLERAQVAGWLLTADEELIIVEEPCSP